MLMDSTVHFESVAVSGGTMIVAKPVGEFDLSNATDIKAQLLGALARTPRLLAVDLAQTTFIDSTILNALVAVHRRAELVGSAFCLTNISAPISKPITITGLDTYLSIYPTVQDAAEAHGCQHPAGRRDELTKA
jgi:anti-sigma B factor antagonist